MDRLMCRPVILLQVIESTDITTLLNLCLTSKAIRHLISSYEASISTTIAKRCFPDLITGLTREEQYIPTIKQLVQLPQRDVARQLSVLAVKISQCAMYPGIPSDNPIGDDLRLHVQNGWLIAWRLSDIAKSVEKTEQKSNINPFLNIKPREITSVRKLESAISFQWLEYVKHIKSDDVFDLLLMQCCRDGRFMWRGVWPPWTHIVGSRGMNELSWIQGFILRKSPRFVLRLWDMDPTVRQEAEDCIKEVASKRSKERFLIEEATSSRLCKDLKSLYPDAHVRSMGFYQDTYRPYVQQRKDQGLPIWGPLVGY
ncbi:MAG: hypothetical protein M1830_003959 [Pleopsidium flavum]|nr:MAG: hypothetical protein M1830_003959 [Pleopsidium flavum]